MFEPDKETVELLKEVRRRTVLQIEKAQKVIDSINDYLSLQEKNDANKKKYTVHIKEYFQNNPDKEIRSLDIKRYLSERQMEGLLKGKIPHATMVSRELKILRGEGFIQRGTHSSFHHKLAVQSKREQADPDFSTDEVTGLVYYDGVR